MENMTLEQIALACGGTYYGPEEMKQVSVAGVVIDSRKVEEGYLYIAIRGERVDGHKFIPDVFAKGAFAVSEEKIKDPAGPYILVSSGPQALKDIAEYYRSTLTIPIVGVAGSVGKTSTKEMIACVLAQKYCVLKTEGNFNNEIGLPLTLLRIRKEHEVAVVEMGISDFGEMHRLAKMARPDICVMTNIGQAHLENLKDRDGILRAKSEMFDFLKPDGAIVLNGNDDKLNTIKEVNGVVPIRYFVADDTAELDYEIGCFVFAKNIVNRGLRGTCATLEFPEEIRDVEVPIPGAHHLYNACAASCVGRILGLTDDEICKGISRAKTLPGRNNVIDMGKILVIDDCYNANPVSMKASLDVLSRADGRTIAVLGDMGELGDNEEELHRTVGRFAAEKGIDVVFCAGALSKYLAETAEAGCEVHYFESRDALLESLLGYVKEGDSLLVKASHFMDYPKIVSALKEKFL